MAEMSDYWLYSMNAPFGRTRVTRGWNRDLVLYDHTFSNLSGMERECARTVRSSSKASNPTFQPLKLVLVPVIKICIFTTSHFQNSTARTPRTTYS